ncbi:MAG: hypothetical protein ACPL7O_09550 [Armatimonadota bacterium]
MNYCVCYNPGMKLHRLILSFIVVTFALQILSGCARTPSGASRINPREVTFQITFDGSINDNYYYYVAIDVNGGGEWPTPVFPGLVTATGWVTGSVTHFVEYHLRQYTVYRVTNVQPLTVEPIGSPLRPTVPAIGGKTLRFTLDLDQIGATGDSIDINFITVDQPLSNTRMLDALGPLGTEFIQLDIRTDKTATNWDGLSRLEPSNDVLDQNQRYVPSQPNPQSAPLDITDWAITTDV